MKAAIVLLCLAVCAVSAHESKPSRVVRLPASSHLVGIKGGQKIKIEKRPYTVAIVDSNNNFVGTGVLINNNWISTAAINVYMYEAADIQIRIGTENAQKGGKLVKASQISVHPQYEGSWQYDIALIKLEHSITVGPKSKPVSLASSLPKAGAKAALTGYGATAYEMETDGLLRDALVPYIPSKVCAKKYAPTEYTFTSQNFCASKPGTGACPLDWGDPLVYNGKLIGHFTGSLGDCDSTTYPGVFLDFTQFRKWIKDTIKP